jgi:hypothetical protein
LTETRICGREIIHCSACHERIKRGQKYVVMKAGDHEFYAHMECWINYGREGPPCP